MDVVRLFAVVAAASTALGPAFAQTPEVAGTTTAVTTTTRGEPPARPERVLEVGTDVVRNERVSTDAGGRAHLLFRDRTALTIGPNSEVVLDEFVYDPATNSGRIALGAASGVLRFVGGRLSRQGALTIETPVAVVGIRGSSAILEIAPDGTTEIIHVTGETTARAKGAPETSRRLIRSGFAVRVTSPDLPPSQPFRVDPARLAGAVGRFEGTPEQAVDADGGDDLPIDGVAALTSEAPTEPAPAGASTTDTGNVDQAAGLDGANDDRVTQTLTSAAALEDARWVATATGDFTFGWTGGGDPEYDRFESPAPGVVPTIDGDRLRVTLDGSEDVDFVVPVERGRVFRFDDAGTVSPFGPIAGIGYVSPDLDAAVYQVRETSNPGEGQTFVGGTPIPREADFDFSQLAAYAVQPDQVLENTIPFLYTRGFGGDITDPVVSPLYRTPPSGRQDDPQLGMAAVAIFGEGREQRSAFMGFGGDIEETANGLAYANGVFRGFAMPDAEASGEVHVGQVRTIPDAGGNHFFGGDTLDVFALNSIDFEDDPIAPDQAAVAYRRTAAQQPERVDYNPTHIVVPTDVPADVGGDLRDFDFRGYAAGVAAHPVQGLRAVGNADPEAVVVRSDVASRGIGARFDLTIGSPTEIGDAGLGDYVVNFGLANSVFTRTVFVDRERWYARESEQSGASSIDGTTSTFEAGGIFPYQAAPLATLPGGVEPCDCPELRFGWWGHYFENENATADDFASEFIMPLGTFVAGDLPDLESLPETGVFTYAGHAIATIVDGDARYIAAGRFEHSFDFARREGTFTLDDLDGHDFSGPVASTNGRDYDTSAGSILSDDGAVRLGLVGSFFGGDDTAADATGGTLALAGVSGTLDGYGGEGTFAGTLTGRADSPPLQGFVRGRWLATPRSGSDFGWTGDGAADLNVAFSETDETGDEITVTLDDGGSLLLPYQVGAFTFDGTETESPFGPVAGAGFVNADEDAGFYQLVEVENPENFQIAFGGEPVAPGRFLDEVSAFQIVPDHALGNTLPFMYPDGFGGALADPSVSLLYGTPSTEVNRGKLGFAGIGIVGEGVAQQTAIVGSVMSLFTDADGFTTAGGAARGFAVPDALARGVRHNGGASTVPDADGNNFFGGESAEVFVLDSVDYFDDPVAFDDVLRVRQQQGGGSVENFSYNVKHPALATAVPDDVGTDRTNRSLSGYAAAMGETPDDYLPLTGREGVPDRDVAIRTDAGTYSVSADFVLEAFETGIVQEYQIAFGALEVPGGDRRSVFLDDGRWVARDRDNNAVSSVNGIASEFEAAMIFTDDMAPVGALPGDVAACDCPYLDWGWWGSYLEHDDPGNPATQEILVPLGTFVAGELPDLEDIPETGTATYTGHAVANIISGEARYVAAATFENSYDFATRQGTVTITDLDGRDFSGTVEAVAGDARRYNNPGNIETDGIAMQVRGAFFQGGGDPVAATGGDIRFENVLQNNPNVPANYEGVGTFAAQR